MENRRELAIVLRAVAYEERHRVVTALTEQHGRITALARNAIQSRRFGGCLDLFTASEWRWAERPGAELMRLEGTEFRRAFDGIRKDFDRLTLASWFSELMLRLAPERTPAPELFRLHANALHGLDEFAAPWSAELTARAASIYLGKLMQLFGTQPRLHECMGCRTPLETQAPEATLRFQIEDAAWTCPHCSSPSAPGNLSRRADFAERFIAVPANEVQGFVRQLSLPFRKALDLEAGGGTLFHAIHALFAFHVPGYDRDRLASWSLLEAALEGVTPVG